MNVLDESSSSSASVVSLHRKRGYLLKRSSVDSAISVGHLQQEAFARKDAKTVPKNFNRTYRTPAKKESSEAPDSPIIDVEGFSDEDEPGGQKKAECAKTAATADVVKSEAANELGSK